MNSFRPPFASSFQPSILFDDDDSVVPSGGAPAGPIVYLEDTFTEASPPVAILSHAMDTGSGWGAVGTQFFRCIAGGKLEDQWGSIGGVIADAGVSNGVARFTVDQGSGSGIILRSSYDGFSRIRFAINAETSIEFYDENGSSLGAKNSGFTIEFPADIVVTLDGETVSATINGDPDTTLEITTDHSLSETHFGPRLGIEGATGDDFSVKSE